MTTITEERAKQIADYLAQIGVRMSATQVLALRYTVAALLEIPTERAEPSAPAPAPMPVLNVDITARREYVTGQGVRAGLEDATMPHAEGVDTSAYPGNMVEVCSEIANWCAAMRDAQKWKMRSFSAELNHALVGVGVFSPATR